MKVEKFIPPSPLKTPVLFLIFNRLETTKKVFEEIRKAKPPRLYIASDGPREHKVGELEKVKAVRDYVLNNIDWNCEVKTLFREKNLGCGRAVSEAITWFFENEEMGIILEDDCLPSQSFFWFCEELLKRYKDDMRIWHIGGYSLQHNLIKESYRFSRLIPCWGWATWKNRWDKYEFDMQSFDPKEEEIYKPFLKYGKYVKNTFVVHLKNLKNNVDIWDTQWAYTCVKNKALSIIPKVSLIKNIGFGSDATHTLVEDSINNLIENNELAFPLIHPDDKVIETEVLDEHYLSIFYKKSILLKIKYKIRRLTKWLK